jgi:hypothetical protein
LGTGFKGSLATYQLWTPDGFDDDPDRAKFFKACGHAVFGGNAFISFTRFREQFGMGEGV